MSHRSALAIASLFACTLVWAGGAPAQTQFELSGDAQFQIGSGLPLPLVEAHDAALARQTAGPDPRLISMASGQLRVSQTRSIPGVTHVVRTDVAIQLPNGPARLSAGGRTGASVTTIVAPFGGLILYQNLSNQFGGPAAARQDATATVVRAAGGTPLSQCIGTKCPVTVVRQRLPEEAPQGASLGFTTQASGSVVPGLASFTPAGAIASLMSTGVPQTITTSHVGGPWTTGRVVISQPLVTPPQLFTLTGSDGRVNGSGSLSLVAGALSVSSLSGPNANRGWLNLNVTELPEPAAGLGAAAALAALLVGHAAMRRRR